jgi:hypothetical protein
MKAIQRHPGHCRNLAATYWFDGCAFDLGDSSLSDLLNMALVIQSDCW